MKAIIRTMTILLALTVLLSGCGLPFFGDSAPAETASAAPAEQTPASFGTAQVQATPSLMAQTTESPDSAVEEPASAEEPVDPEEPGSAAEPGSAVEPEPIDPELEPDPDADMTELLIKSALCADYVNDLWYDPDGAFFWRAVGYLMSEAGVYSAEAETGKDEDGAYIRLPAEALTPFVEALFDDHFAQSEGEYPDLGEETDIVKWESTEDGEFYLVHVQDLDDYTVEYEETEWADHYNATLLVDGKAAAVYELTLEKAEDDKVFPLHISEMAYAGKP